MKEIDPSQIARLLSYDPDTGTLVWKKRPDSDFAAGSRQSQSQCAHNWNARYAGTIAGNITPRGYSQVGLLGRLFKAHRLAWCIYYGDWPSAQIDHINGNKCDNRIANLRDVSQTENCRNTAMSKNNTSGLRGVYWKAAINKWTASICIDGKQRHIGVYTSKDEAHAARVEAERSCGYHPNHGRR